MMLSREHIEPSEGKDVVVTFWARPDTRAVHGKLLLISSVSILIMRVEDGVESPMSISCDKLVAIEVFSVKVKK